MSHISVECQESEYQSVEDLGVHNVGLEDGIAEERSVAT